MKEGKTHLVTLAETVKLKVGHHLHVLEDEVLVAVEELLLLQAVPSHEAERLLVVEAAEEHGVVRGLLIERKISKRAERRGKTGRKQDAPCEDR
jgi:hypothetical protein